MKKILSYLLIFNFALLSISGTIQANAEESDEKQEIETTTETELTEINSETISESKQRNDIETNDTIETNTDSSNIETDAKVETESIRQEESNNDLENNNYQPQEDFTPSARVAADSERPVIDTSSIWIDNTSVCYGDTVTIRVKATDNDKIDHIYISLENQSSSNNFSADIPFYNEELGLYELSITMDDTVVAGAWYISSIIAYDITGNYSIESFSNTDYTFTLISDVDSENPVIDESSFIIDKKNVNYEETINFKIKVTDNIEVKNVSICFRNENTSNSIYGHMEYDQNTEYYEYTLTIDDSVPSGNWSIYYISALDKMGNYSMYNPNKEFNFTVINPNVDSESPHIYKDSIKINKLNPITGDTVNIQIKIVENGTMDEVLIGLNNIDTGHRLDFRNMIFNPDTNMYEYSFTIDDSITVGHWDFSIHAKDLIGNLNIESFHEKGHILLITDKGEDIHDWDDGVITKKPTSTEEGVKTYTCKLWACGATKTEAIPKVEQNDSTETDDNESDNDDIITDDNNNDNNTDNIGNDDNSNNNSESSNSDENNTDYTEDDANSSIPSWIPTTEEEKIRFECFGKEKINYNILNNSVINVSIQNSVQGEKCFEVFKNFAGDYNIIRTYNIYPLNNTQKYSTDKKVILSLAIPETLRQENREFKLICVSQNGTPYIFEDQDKNLDTITISTDKFYAYALIYKDKE